MPTRHNPESYNLNRGRAAERRNVPEHAHNVAEQQGKQDYRTGPEISRQTLENSQDARRQEEEPAVGHAAVHGIAQFGHEDIAILAHKLWQARGCPDGSPEEDWYHAAEQLRSRAYTR